MFRPPDMPDYIERVKTILDANTSACQWDVVEQGGKVKITFADPLVPVTVTLHPMPEHLDTDTVFPKMVRLLAKEAIERAAVATFLKASLPNAHS